MQFNGWKMDGWINRYFIYLFLINYHDTLSLISNEVNINTQYCTVVKRCIS